MAQIQFDLSDDLKSCHIRDKSVATHTEMKVKSNICATSDVQFVAAGVDSHSLITVCDLRDKCGRLGRCSRSMCCAINSEAQHGTFVCVAVVELDGSFFRITTSL